MRESAAGAAHSKTLARGREWRDGARWGWKGRELIWMQGFAGWFRSWVGLHLLVE
jgi:hypothetical protein